MIWKQLIGVAMGFHLAPSYANMYFARRIDNKIKELGLKYGEDNKSAIFFNPTFFWMILSKYSLVLANNLIYLLKK